jgi:hypothetical protein
MLVLMCALRLDALCAAPTRTPIADLPATYAVTGPCPRQADPAELIGANDPTWTSRASVDTVI